MANGHVETSNSSIHNDKSSTDSDPASGKKDLPEFRLLMAYAQRRRGERATESRTQDGLVVGNGNTDTNVTAPSQPLAETETETADKKKKKKKGWRRLLRIFKCIKPQTEEEPQQIAGEEHDVDDRCGDFKEDENKEEKLLEEVARRVAEIADEIPFTPPDVEEDGPTDDPNVERMIGLLLRDSGDRLNEEQLKDMDLAREIWNYTFFKTLISALLGRMGLRSPYPDSPGPHASPKTQIAVTCEATTRLSAMDTLPMNRLLGYGARYLSEHFSSWAQQQGGYEAAFKSDDEDDVQ